MNRKRVVRYIGNLLMVVAIGFMLYKLYQYREDFIGAFTWRIGLIMLVSAIVTACVFVGMGVMYAKLVERISGKKVPIGLAAGIYCKSNLYKYIPGNVLQYVGRNQIAEYSNAGHDQVVFASLVEMATQAAGALLVAFILSRSYVLDWFRRQNTTLVLSILATIAILAVIAILILKKRNNPLIQRFEEFLTLRNVGFLLTLLVFLIISQVVNGMLFVWLMNRLANGLEKSYWSNVAGVYCFAWLVGFITPGAPGGMGIRETLLSVLLANAVPPQTVTAAVILNRIVTILGDVLAYFMSKLLHKLDKT